MDIAALSSSLALSQTQTEIGTRVMAMTMDVVESEGDNMIKALEQSVNPNLGANIDIRL